MIGKCFHSVTNRNGITGIRCNSRAATTILCYKSPYATIKQNEWLERNLIRLYTAYYYKVLWETTGQFWKNSEPAITVSYADFYGGETLGDSIKKSIER